MVLVGAADRLITSFQLLDDVRLPGHGEEGREPVVVLDDLVRDLARLDLTRPAHDHRNAERALPVGVFLAAERRHRAVRPGVHMRAVVGRIHDERVVRDAGFVEEVERLADVLVMVDHRVVIGRLPASRLPLVFRLGVSEGVHVGRVEPDEERLARVVRFFHELAWRARRNRRRRFPCAFLVSGPVSSIFCLPTLPQRGSTVASSVSVAKECMTPRGPNVL